MRVHAKTITEFSEGKHGSLTNRKRVHTMGKKVSPVASLTVTNAVWKEALKLAGNDRHRIQVIDEANIIVWNSPEHCKVMRKKYLKETV